jgi:hypothetical protein
MAARLAIHTPHVTAYLGNKKAMRAQLAAAAGISVDDAKFVLLAMIYGATLARSPGENTHAIEERVGKEAADLIRNFKPVLDLHRDVKRARAAILKDYASRTKKKGYLVNDAGREIIASAEPRELLAHILQGAESCALEVMLRELQGSVALLQHDGLTCHGEPLVPRLEREILARTGYRLTLEVDRL